MSQSNTTDQRLARLTVDVDLPTRCPQLLVSRILAEFESQLPTRVVAYRGKHRWAQAYQPVRLNRARDRASRLRPGGVYLIIGGLGGLGLVFAEELARSVQAKLLLVGRSSFPRQTEWDTWLTTHPDDDKTSRKIQKLRELTELGADVVLASADVGDRQQMQTVIMRAGERFGQIHTQYHSKRSLADHTRSAQERIVLPPSELSSTVSEEGDVEVDRLSDEEVDVWLRMLIEEERA